MKYSELKLQIALGTHLPDYYEQLLIHSRAIILDIAATSRKQVADELGMHYSKLTHIIQLLAVVANNDKLLNIITDNLEAEDTWSHTIYAKV